MNVEQEISNLLEQIKRAGKQIRFARKHKALLEQLPHGYFYPGGSLDFDDLKHKQVIALIRELGGKWTKELNSQAGKIDYETKIDGIPVRAWRGEAPPSCRIVEVEQFVPEQLVPAHTIKVKKMVCQPQLSAIIAQAAERGQPAPAPAPVQPAQPGEEVPF